MILTVDQIAAFFTQLEQMQTLLIIVVTIAVCCISVAVSGFPYGIIRGLFYFILAAVMFLLALELDDINSEYFLNLTTELLGAVAVAVLLSKWIVNQRWLFPIIMVIVCLTTLPIEQTDGITQQFFVNMSTEVLGAFLTIVLVTHRGWLWNNIRKPNLFEQRERDKLQAEWELEKDKLKAQWELEQERRFEEWKAEEKRKYMTALRAQMSSWESQMEKCDLGLLVVGTDTQNLKAKIGYVKKFLKIEAAGKQFVEPDSETIMCYLLGVCHPVDETAPSKPTARNREQ